MVAFYCNCSIAMDLDILLMSLDTSVSVFFKIYDGFFYGGGDR